MELIPDLLDMGVNGLNPIEPYGMDNVFNYPMVNHIFVDGNLYHERTEFKSKGGNTVVYVNTDMKPWSPMPGVTISALGFYIYGPKLLAYHAEEVGGKKFSQPALAVFKGDLRSNREVSAYRAFGDEDLTVVSGRRTLHARVGETCKTVITTLG